jgi:site-specific DNA-methyltransferase (adenine-specific)
MSAPYYQADGVTLWHGDCLDITDWLAADVLVTDPPYGMKYRSGRTGATVVGDDSTAVRDAALTAWGPDRPALAFGTWRAPRPEGVRELLIWWKDNSGASSGNTALPFGPTHEEVYLLGTNWAGAPPGRIGSVLRTTVCMGNPHGPAAQLGHPTPKPVNLMERLIGKCPPGTIADPFAGSGSTLIAARNQGRAAIGVEIEERYCELIARRLSQGALFTGDTA